MHRNSFAWRRIKYKDEEESSHQQGCNGRNVNQARQRGGEQRCMPTLPSLPAAAPQSAASLPCGLHRDIHREAGTAGHLSGQRPETSAALARRQCDRAYPAATWNGIANDGSAAKDGLPKNSVTRLVFVKTTQGYPPAFPRTLHRIAFSCAA